MNVLVERPSTGELDQLSELAATLPLDRERLIGALRRIEDGLRERGRDLDQSGGLLDEGARAARMSLAREDERLRHEIAALLRTTENVRRAAGDTDDEEMRSRFTALLAGLRGHRDAEARLVLESTATEVGAGD